MHRHNNYIILFCLLVTIQSLKICSYGYRFIKGSRKSKLQSTDYRVHKNVIVESNVNFEKNIAVYRINPTCLRSQLQDNLPEEVG